MRTAAFIVPAYRAAATVAEVVHGLDRAWSEAWGELGPEQQGAWHPRCRCLVVDDGSEDATPQSALAAGAEVVRHGVNRGKGAALSTGFAWAHREGLDRVVTVDADGQHPPEEAARLMLHPAPSDVLLLGVRDLVAAGAPRPNRFSNAFSNLFLSGYCRRRLHDTQCGLRRYPVDLTLELGPRDPGYAFEAEIILRFARTGHAIAEEPVQVIYPPESERITHFHSVRDPARIVRRVLWTVATVPLRR